MATVSDQPGWTPPSDQPDVPPGWAPQQPPAYRPAGTPPGAGQQPAPHAPQGWQQPGGHQPGWGQQAGWGQQPGWSQQPPWTPPPPPPKPGVIPLRPLGVGEVLDGAISAIRAQPALMLGLSAVVAVVTQLLTVPLTWLLLRDAGDAAFSVSEPADPGEDFAFAASALSAAGIQVVVTLVAALLLTGILTVAVSRAVLGERIGAREAWERARPRLPALLGVTLLVILVELGVLTVSLGPGILLAVASAPAPLVVVAFVVGIPLGVAAAVYLYVAYALAPATVVLERQRVVASLRRSRGLVQGAWWRTFGILLLVNVIAQVLSGIISVPTTVITVLVSLTTGSGNPYEILPLLVTALGTIVASAITWPFTAVSTALLYVDRRIRREALDIELARAAGVSHPGGAVAPRTPTTGAPSTGPG
jgi:hypothetical protein